MSFDYINALLRKPVTRTPIWVMRQAGRYLPEYRETRKKAGDFMALCKSPDLACEVTMQPLMRYDLDAAILFSDILTIPDAMNLGLYFAENEGPKFENPIKDLSDIKKLPQDVMSDLTYVTDAITAIKKELNNSKPLIGFSGSPWTLSTYMVEGGSSKNFTKIKSLMYQNPEDLHLLLDKLTSSIIDYLNAQIAAGVDSIMIFDTWGGILTKRNYLDFSLHYMQKIVTGVNKTFNDKVIPITLFTKNGGMHLEDIANTNCDCIGIDWTIELKEAQQRLKNSVALQGNLDPCVLYAKPKIIEQEVKKILNQFSGETGHIFNLGHGLFPDINPEHMQALVDSVHKFGTN